MRITWILVCLFLLKATFAQKGNYRLFAEINTSYTYGSFGNGKVLYTNDPSSQWISPYSKYEVQPRWSLDLPYQGLNFTMFARKFHYKVGVQKYLSPKLSAIFGFEVGGRLFAIMSTDSYYGGSTGTYVLRSIRNYALPLQVMHSSALSEKIALSEILGFSLNIPVTLYDDAFPYQAKPYSPLYLLLNTGLELEYKLSNGQSMAMNLMFNPGFKNIIDDKLLYEMYDMNTWEHRTEEARVYSNGTHLSLGLRFYFHPHKEKTRDHQFKPALIDPLIMYKKRVVTSPVNIKVDSNYVRLCVWDDQRIDGDSVTIEYKDSVLMNKVALTKEMYCITLRVERNQPNYIVVHAVNEGRIKPNTVQVMIIDHNGEKKVNAKCDLKKSASFNLHLE
jgi:hypothetical protein